MTSPESDQQETKDNKATATTKDVTEPLFRLALFSRNPRSHDRAPVTRTSCFMLLGSINAPAREVWRKHCQEVAGTKGAEVQAAAQAALRLDEGFMRQRFDADERLATRLGANDRIVELPDGTKGPFDRPIRRITIPGWMGPNITPEGFSTACCNRIRAYF